MTLVPVALMALLLCSCASDERVGNASTVTGTAVCCSETAASVFLKSRTDDDDGDGNVNDENFPAINDEDDDIADHAWVQDDGGLYHLFFQNEGLDSGSDIEHYTSTDLQSLEYVGVALERNPTGWDAHGLWAPHVIRSGDTYWMFYTGTAGFGPDSKQRIGAAISSDLMAWTRLQVNNCHGVSGDGCVYECDEDWTTWGDALGSYNQQCRDPFVVWDSEHQRWVMFATAKSQNLFGVVTVAYSTTLLDWDGGGYIDATRRLVSGTAAQTTGGQAENPFVMSRGGAHYLLFSDWQDPEDHASVTNPRTMVQVVTSSTLEADSLGSANWTYQGYTPDPGVNAIEVQRLGETWLMTQSISNANSGDISRPRQLRLKCVNWGDGLSFGTSNVEFLCVPGLRAASPVSIRVESAPR